MGSVHHLTRYIPKIAQIAAALRPLLKNTEKNKPLNWSPELSTAFKNKLKLVAEITQNKHFDQHLDTSIVCDPTTTGPGGWKIQRAPFIRVDDQKANFIGRNILSRIGIELIQEKQKLNVLSVREQEESDPDIKQWVKDDLQQLCIRIGKSKHHMIRNQFNKDFNPIQQKGRRTPVNPQERVEGGRKQADEPKHIIKLNKSSDRRFIKPMGKTVKKDQTV